MNNSHVWRWCEPEKFLWHNSIATLHASDAVMLAQCKFNCVFMAFILQYGKSTQKVLLSVYCLSYGNYGFGNIIYYDMRMNII